MWLLFLFLAFTGETYGSLWFLFLIIHSRIPDPRTQCCCCCCVASLMSDSVWPHRRQPTRLPRPWDSPGKNTGVGCHFLLQCLKVKSESEVSQSCPTLSNPMDCSLPGSSAHGIFQARVLEWIAIAFSTIPQPIFFFGTWVYSFSAFHYSLFSIVFCIFKFVSAKLWCLSPQSTIISFQGGPSMINSCWINVLPKMGSKISSRLGSKDIYF